MSRKKKHKKFKKRFDKREKRFARFALPVEIKQMIFGVLMILIAVIAGLSFFDKAGKAGLYFMKAGRFLVGETVFLIPLVFILGGLVLLFAKDDQKFFKKERKTFWPVILAGLVLIFGITGISAGFNPESMKGGWLGYLLSWPLLKYFGFWATQIIFLALIVIGSLIFWHFLGKHRKKEALESPQALDKEEAPVKPSIIKRIFIILFK